MANLRIVCSRIGYSNSILLVNGANSIIVDTGVKGHLNRFKNLLKQFKLVPTDIKLIVLTHVHYDHTGNLSSLAKLTGAKVLVHKNEFENLKNGFIQIPLGQGRYSGFISKFGRSIYPKFASPKSYLADIINDDEYDLSEFGIDARVISTPGHTRGSQSVLYGKKLISGDTFINLKNGEIFPPFANEPKILLKTWKRIFDMGIEEIYPGHGKPFKVEKAFQEFEKWKNRLQKIS